MPLRSFPVGLLLLKMLSAHKRILFPRKTPLERIKCSLASDCQLEIGSGLGMMVSHVSTSPFTSRTPSDADSSRPWIKPKSLSVHIYLIRLTLRALCLSSTWLFHSVCFLLQRVDQSLEGRDLMGTFHLGMNVTWSLMLCI